MEEITIRKAKPADAKGFVKLWNEGLKSKFFVYNGSNWKRGKKDESKAKKSYSSKNKSEGYFVAIDNKSKKLIGVCPFRGNEKGRTRHRVELGWAVHPAYAGKGIATRLLMTSLEEAKRRGFHRAEAEAAIENVASVKLAQKCGFSIEGIKKDGLLLDDGRYVDTYLFGKILN